MYLCCYSQPLLGLASLDPTYARCCFSVNKELEPPRASWNFLFSLSFVVNKDGLQGFRACFSHSRAT